MSNAVVISDIGGDPISVTPLEDGVSFVSIVGGERVPIIAVPGTSGVGIVSIESDQAPDGTVTLTFLLTNGTTQTVTFKAGGGGPLPIDLELAGVAIGHGVATATLQTWIELAAVATGRGTAIATTDNRLDVASAATGRGAASGMLRADLDLTASATGRGAASAAASFVLELAGEAVGRGSASGMLTLGNDLSLQATALGIGTATGVVLLELNVAGNAVGRGQASGTLSALADLAGQATGRGVASGALAALIEFAGQATGKGVASGTVTLEAAGGGYDTDAQNAFNAMTVQPNAQRKTLYNDMIVGLKADGVWNKLDWLNILAAHDAQAARLNIKNPAKLLAAVNIPSFVVDRGYASDNVSSHLSFGEAFNASGNGYALNSAHLAVWCSAQGGTAGYRAHIGSSQSTRSFIGPHTTGAGQARMNDSASLNLGSADTAIGGRIFSRTASNARAYYRNGAVSQSDATAASAVATGPAYLLRNGNDYTDDRLSAASTGSGLTATEVQALHNRVNTFLTAIGAA